MKPELESMVDVNEAPSLTVAAEQYATVYKYAGVFLLAFTFRSARRHNPLLAAIALVKRLHAEKRRTLPERVPLTHLSQTDRRLILEGKNLIAVSTRSQRSRLCATGLDLRTFGSTGADLSV